MIARGIDVSAKIPKGWHLSVHENTVSLSCIDIDGHHCNLEADIVNELDIEPVINALSKQAKEYTKRATLANRSVYL